jgi:hypothetical protein
LDALVLAAFTAAFLVLASWTLQRKALKGL